MKLILLFFYFFFPTAMAIAQDSSFVQRDGALLMLAGRSFCAVGANCYYLHDLAVQGWTRTQLSRGGRNGLGALDSSSTLGFPVLFAYLFVVRPGTGARGFCV
jgi:hypothetical protein